MYTINQLLAEKGTEVFSIRSDQAVFSAIETMADKGIGALLVICLLYTSPSPRDLSTSRMPSSA